MAALMPMLMMTLLIFLIYIYIAQDDFDLSIHEGFSTLDIDLVKLPKRIKLKEKQNYPLLLIKMKVGLLMVRVEFHF